jgi:hypothetical protein
MTTPVNSLATPAASIFSGSVMARRLLPSMNSSTAMKMEETEVRMGSIRRDTR